MTNKKQVKQDAQDKIMYKIADLLGYWYEDTHLEQGSKKYEEMEKQLKKQADRVAKLFGFEKSWKN